MTTIDKTTQVVQTMWSKDHFLYVSPVNVRFIENEIEQEASGDFSWKVWSHDTIRRVVNRLINEDRIRKNTELTAGLDEVIRKYTLRRASAESMIIEEYLKLAKPEDIGTPKFLGFNAENLDALYLSLKNRGVKFLLNEDAQNKVDERSRRLTIESQLTGDGQHGFTVYQTIGNAKQGFSYKKVSYDSSGRKLVVDTQGRSKNGWVPETGDLGFEGMSTQQMEELLENVRLQEKVGSASKEERSKIVNDLRSESPTTRFGEDAVKANIKSQDDALFLDKRTGLEYDRKGLLWLVKNEPKKWDELFRRDMARLNRILGAE